MTDVNVAYILGEKKEILSFLTPWMNLEDTLSEISNVRPGVVFHVYNPGCVGDIGRRIMVNLGKKASDPI
jgi:hypothetical protein